MLKRNYQCLHFFTFVFFGLYFRYFVKDEICAFISQHWNLKSFKTDDVDNNHFTAIFTSNLWIFIIEAQPNI